MKKWISLMLVLIALLTAVVPAMAATPVIRKVEYEGSGRVEVEFGSDVQYKGAKVRVKDSSGKLYSARISEKDSDDLSFKVSSIAAGKTYSFQIAGVRAGRSGSYVAVTGSFKVPAAKALAIKEVEYDGEDRELEIEFNTNVQYKNLRVRVKDSSGRITTGTIRDKDGDSVEVRVKGLSRGARYDLEVKGVRVKGSGSYGTIYGSFVAR